MKTVKYNVIGLMSGTSCDGLDIANCIFWQDKRKWCYEIKKTNCEILALEHDDPKDYKDYVSKSLNFLSNI